MSDENDLPIGVTGNLALAGAISMLGGAIFWGITGTDLWQALEKETIASFLNQLQPVKSLLVVNTTFWIVGVLLMGSALISMASFSSKKTAWLLLTRMCCHSAVSIAIVSFIIMLSLTIKVAPENSENAVFYAEVTGWIGARLDDLATLLIIGVCPFLVTRGKDSGWAPNWLKTWSFITFLCAIVSMICMYLNIAAPGFIIVPVGIGWMIAAGLTLRRGA